MKYVVFFLMFIVIPVFGQKKWIYPCALNNILKSNQLAEYVTSESSSSNRHLCFQIDTIKLNCNFAVFTTEILKNKGKDLWKENVKPDLINQIEDSLSKVSIKFNRDTNAPFILSQKTFDCSQKTEYLLITFTNYSNDLGLVARIRMINNRVAEIQGRDLFMYIEFDKKKRIKKVLSVQVFND